LERPRLATKVGISVRNSQTEAIQAPGAKADIVPTLQAQLRSAVDEGSVVMPGGISPEPWPVSLNLPGVDEPWHEQLYRGCLANVQPDTVCEVGGSTPDLSYGDLGILPGGCRTEKILH